MHVEAKYLEYFIKEKGFHICIGLFELIFIYIYIYILIQPQAPRDDSVQNISIYASDAFCLPNVYLSKV